MNERLFRSVLLFLITGCFLALTACSGMSGREKGALGGATVGAGLGAIVGAASGDAGVGTAIGAGVGALSGGLIGNEIDKADRREREQLEKLDRLDAVIAENQRLIDEFKSRGADAYLSERGVVVNFPDVLFEFDKARLTTKASRTVDEIATVLETTGDRHIAVEGHTDSVGTISYNKRLSTDRAKSVADALTQRGISRRRISTKGFGESDPVASNATSTGRARNRRVEVIVENY